MQHQDRVFAVAFSADGKQLLTAQAGGSARLWNAWTGEAIGEELKHNGPVVAVAFSPDNKRAITASDDNTIQLWELRTCLPIGNPMIHKDDVGEVVFSPDGKRVLTASTDGTARLWSVPPPAIYNDIERLQLSVEVRTGKRLNNNGEAKWLSINEWNERRDALSHQGRPYDAPSWEEYELSVVEREWAGRQ